MKTISTRWVIVKYIYIINQSLFVLWISLTSRVIQPETEIPVNPDNGLQDWDCPEAFDLVYLNQVLTEIKQSGGTIPASFESKEETNTLGPSNVTDEELAEVQRSIAVDVNTLFVIVDGIMLFNEGSPLIATPSATPDSANPLDLALFVRAPYFDLLKRREARAGYVTLEGFWADPPGYFDDIVWPGYVKSHSYLFEDGQVDGPLTTQAASEFGIRTPAQMNCTMLELLQWSVNEIKRSLL